MYIIWECEIDKGKLKVIQNDIWAKEMCKKATKMTIGNKLWHYTKTQECCTILVKTVEDSNEMHANL